MWRTSVLHRFYLEELSVVKEIIKLEKVFLAPITITNIVRRFKEDIHNVLIEADESDLSIEYVFNDSQRAHLFSETLRAYGHTEVQNFSSPNRYWIEVTMGCLIDKRQMRYNLDLHQFPVENP